MRWGKLNLPLGCFPVLKWPGQYPSLDIWEILKVFAFSSYKNALSRIELMVRGLLRRRVTRGQGSNSAEREIKPTLWMNYRLTSILFSRALVGVIYISFWGGKCNKMNSLRIKKNITYPSGNQNSMTFFQQGSSAFTLCNKVKQCFDQIYQFWSVSFVHLCLNSF